MDFNNILTWLVGLSAIMTIVRAIRFSTAASRGWIVVSLFTLIAMALTFLIAPTMTGWVGIALWAMLAVIPSLGFRVLHQLTLRQQYSRARRLAMFLRWLHPTDGWWEQPILLQAMELGRRGALAEATEILSRYQTSITATGRMATIEVYRLNGQWVELLSWLEHSLPPKILERDPNMIVIYLRAVGETGDLNSLLKAFDRFTKTLERTNQAAFRNLARLFIFAFCGDKEQVTRLFEGTLAAYPSQIQNFWLATADLAAGHEQIARRELESLLETSDSVTQIAIKKRLARPPANPDTELTADTRLILARAELELDQEERYGGQRSLTYKRAYITYSLISLNLIIFGLEISMGGSEDLKTLYQMGALLPELVIFSAAQWWRFLAAQFLHFGFLHLFMNMLALYIIGPFVEFALGTARYLLTYLTAGVGAMFLIVLLTMAGYFATGNIYVGASGCITGLIGATAAILLRGWRTEKAKVASRRLLIIMLIIALQSAFDLFTPEVSFTAHFGGVVIGFGVASLMRHAISGATTT